VASTDLVDVHHHFVPPAYRDALVASGNQRPDGIGAIPEWSEAAALGLMDQVGIRMAFLSITSPGVLLDGCNEVDLARHVNEVSAGLIASNPGRFGAFATLPLPDVDASLTEIERSLDDHGLDGVVALTHYRDHYLGSAVFDPIFEELDRRHAVVFVHPTSPLCCADTSLGYPAPVLEFMFDTTRAVMNLVYSGTLDRFPNVQWIIPHAGAALPALAARLEAMPLLSDRTVATSPFRTYLDRMMYDLAGPRTDTRLSELLSIAGPTQLLYGSDWPFTPGPAVQSMLSDIDALAPLGASTPRVTLSDNARRVLPRSGTTDGS